MPYLGQIALFPFWIVPKGWALCQGQLLPIASNLALFNIIGVIYGGDGRTTFALPDLRGRVPLNAGQFPGGQEYVIGEVGGAETVGLASSQNGLHTHGLPAVANPNADSTEVGGNLLGTAYAGNSQANVLINMYSSNAPNATLAPGVIYPSSGEGNPHDNIQPYLALNYCICLDGDIPTRPQ